MASPSHPLRILGAGAAAVVLLPTTFLGVVGAISDGGPMRPVWAVMAISGAAGVYGAISTVRGALRTGAEERERLTDARGGAAPADVLARWSFDRAEILRIARIERHTHRIEIIAGAAGLFALGTWVVWGATDGEAWAAPATGGFLGGLYLVIGLAKHGMAYQEAVHRGHDVVVFEDSVVVFGTWHSLGGGRSLIAAALTDDVLELTVRWDTSKGGPAEETIRVPVPPEQHEEAERVLRFFQGRIGAT